ncbi:MAG: hypothetical protein ACFFDS_05190 [Candidatus Thorarchaeota archaeon]
MSEEIPYGFEIEKVTAFRNHYVINDLARGKTILEADVFGGFKPVLSISDLDEKEILSAKKTSFWGSTWNIFRKGEKIASFISTGNACNPEYQIRTEISKYIVSRIKFANYIVFDSLGKEVVSLTRDGWGFSMRYIVEVNDEFEPLIALGVALILVTLIQQQAAATSGAMVATMG